MPARFFFHTSDGHIYGPVDFPTLTRWQTEKRINEGSKIREEETGKFLTYGELAANPPLIKEPAPPTLSVATTEPATENPVEQPPLDSENEGPVFTLPELIRRGFDLYRRGFSLLWPLTALIQSPLFILNYLFPQKYDPVTNLPTWGNNKTTLLIFGAMLTAALMCEVGSGLITNLIQQMEEDRPISFPKALESLRGRIFPLCKTWVLRILIIASWAFLAAMIYGMISQLALPSALRKIILMVLLFPAILLFLRYLISTQVVILEKVDGLQALRRSGDLVRFSNTRGTFISGDLRLLILAVIPWIAIFTLTALIAPLGGSVPTKFEPIFSSILSFIGAATATPFLIILFVLFVIDSRRRLRQSGYDRPQS